MTIEIKRDDILRAVARRMEWEGKVIDADGTLSDTDRALFHSLFDEAAMHALDICRTFATSASNSDEALTLELSLSKDAKADDLPMAMDNMMTAHVLALWLEIVNPDRAETALRKKETASSKVLSIIYHHPAPRRN